MANEETKRSPYCGEEILAVAKKCKHCGEWLDKEETKICSVCGEKVPANTAMCPHCKEPQGSPEQHNSAEVVQEDILYCRHCKAPLSKSSQSCPHCGEDDPFLLKAIAKERKQTNFGCVFAFMLAIIIVFITRDIGETGGLLNPTKTQYFIFVGVLILFSILRWFVRKAKVDECSKVMEKIAMDKNNTSIMKRWQEMVEEIKKK